MQTNSSKYFTIIGLVIVALALIVWKMNSGGQNSPVNTEVSPTPVAENGSTPTPASTPAKTTTTPKVTTPTKTSTGTTYKTAPVTSSTNYNDYITQLRLKEAKCQDTAQQTYKQVYASSLEASSFQSYFVAKTGMCFLKVSGKVHPAFSTTTTGHIYFRNLSTSAMIAECADNTGITFADSEWVCTDKTTNQTINMAQFNAIINSFTAVQ